MTFLACRTRGTDRERRAERAGPVQDRAGQRRPERPEQALRRLLRGRSSVIPSAAGRRRQPARRRLPQARRPRLTARRSRSTTRARAPLPRVHHGARAAARLGMVPTCAPHWTYDNHVSETNDVMTGGSSATPAARRRAGRLLPGAHPGLHRPRRQRVPRAPPPGVPGAVTAVGGRRRRPSASRRDGTVTAYTVTSTPGRRDGTGRRARSR